MLSTIMSPSQNSIPRRTFLKTSAFTVGAYTILSQGIALASESGDYSAAVCPPHNFKRHRWLDEDIWRVVKICQNSGCTTREQAETGTMADDTPKDWNELPWDPQSPL
jgi:hypothetical protein